MTMVPSSALATEAPSSWIGSYFFPLLYAIFSSSFYLQHAQSPSWIDHSIDLGFAFTMANAFDDVDLTATMVRLSDFPNQAEAPSVCPLRHPRLCVASPLRRVWDPGINSSSRLDESIMLTVASMAAMPSFMASAMSTVATASSVGWQSLFHYSHPVLSRPAVPNVDS